MRISYLPAVSSLVILQAMGCLSASTATSSDGGTTGASSNSSSSSTISHAETGGPAVPDATATETGGGSMEGGTAREASASGNETGAGSFEAGASGDGSAASRCMMTTAQITCTQAMYTITTPAGSDVEAGTTYPSYSRVVHYQVPLGTAPAAGWPAVFMFQGSFLSAGLTFSATSNEEYGLYYQTEVVKNLLDAGYAVLAPEALDSGNTYWQTNISPYAAEWSGAPDDLLIQAMFADVKNGVFGPLDSSSLYATGISSGGYMTSRMAVSYPGRFKALAIESGSYATCLSGESAVTGGACTVPPLAATNPPTLFLHGDLDTVIVPEWTVTAYKTALTTASVATKEIDDANSGHQWIPEAPAAVLAWFQTYP